MVSPQAFGYHISTYGICTEGRLGILVYSISWQGHSVECEDRMLIVTENKIKVTVVTANL